MLINTNVVAQMPHRNMPPKFAGQKEFEAFNQKLDTFSPDSLEKLAEIKRKEVEEAPKHALHIQLAMTLGKVDANIKWINQQIMGLLKLRNDHKTTDPVQSDLAKEHLGDLRDAIEHTLIKNGYDAKGQKQA